MYKLKTSVQSLKEDIYVNNLAVIIDWNTGLFYVPNGLKKDILDFYGIILEEPVSTELAVSIGKKFKGERNKRIIKQTIAQLNYNYLRNHHIPNVRIIPIPSKKT